MDGNEGNASELDGSYNGFVVVRWMVVVAITCKDVQHRRSRTV